MPRINVIQPEEATGALKEIFDQLLKERGQIAEVHKIQSLRPESIVKHMDLYMEIMFSKSKLSRSQREMIAVIVSRANGCTYCVKHHGSALNFYWKDIEKLNQLIEDYKNTDLTENDIALCEYAEQLTRYPGQSKEQDFTENLKRHGFSDEAVLDATLVISYFNFVNRIVLSLDVGLESDEGKNYKY